MTERKPAGKSFTSWIDQQISEAQERGAFDDLPGAGKPLPRRSAADDAQAWLRDKLQREGVSTEELLPAPLKLRKQAERLAEGVQELPTEGHVREAVAELNRRIIEWRRIPLGPQIFVPLVNAEQMVSRWREGHPGPVARTSAKPRTERYAVAGRYAAAGQDAAAAPDAAGRDALTGQDAAAANRAGQPARTRWWRRVRRRG